MAKKSAPKFKIPKNVIYRNTLVNELTVLKMENLASYYKLTDIAAKAWFKFEKPSSVESCAQALEKETGFTCSDLVPHIQKLTKDLVKAKLLVKA